MGTDNKVYSYSEVSFHNTAKDCWMIINGKVYNVSNFLDDHPGGGDVLLEAAGKDASEEFEAAGHGSAARLMLDEYYVAEIDPSTKPTPISAPEPALTFTPHELADDTNKGTSPMPTIIKLLPLLMPLVILGFAAIIRVCTSSNAKSFH